MTTIMQRKYKEETGKDPWDCVYGFENGENHSVYVEALTPDYIDWVEKIASQSQMDKNTPLMICERCKGQIKNVGICNCYRVIDA